MNVLISLYRPGTEPTRVRLRDLDELHPHEIAQRDDHQELFDYLCGSPLWGYCFETTRWVKWKKPADLRQRA